MACDLLVKDHQAEMEQYENRYMVLLIDFDRRNDRIEEVRDKIPGHLRERVFILGTWDEPEDLPQELGSLEKIGLALAKDCREETTTIWDHPLLRHNAPELERLRQLVRPFLFRA